MNPSIIYYDTHIYHFFMRLLYGRHFEDRYKIVAEQIPSHTSVVDVCAGDAYLYTKYLKTKYIDYLAVDNSPHFIQSALKRKIKCQRLNIIEDRIPYAEVVVMMASLYQFIPFEKDVLQKLINCSKFMLIITEPISNLSSSHSRFISRVAHTLSIPFQANNKYNGERFDHDRVINLFHSYPEFQFSKLIPGEREVMGVFMKKRK